MSGVGLLVESALSALVIGLLLWAPLGGTLTLVGAAVLLSGTRAAWLAFLLGISAIGWILGRPRLGRIALLVAIAASVVALSVAGTTAPRRLLSVDSYRHDQRVVQWRAALALAAEAPLLGHGPLSFRWLCEERHREEPFREIYLPSAPYPHDLFLEALVGAGGLGLFAFAFLLCQPILAIRRGSLEGKA